ncbi:hypothetical protein [Nocardia terpenica]|nr:hypothetical protein [Nocardia terpenica]
MNLPPRDGETVGLLIDLARVLLLIAVVVVLFAIVNSAGVVP